MRREFLFNIIFLIAINVLIKPFYTFFIETEVQNLVGPQEYGIYFSLFNLSYIFQIFLDLGIHNYGSQYLAKDSSRANQYLSNALASKGIMTMLFSLIIIVIGWILNYDMRMTQILWLVSINQIFISFIFFFRSSLAALGHYRSNSFISVIDKILMIAGFSYLLFVSNTCRDDFSLYHFIGMRMVTYILTTIISLFLLLRIGKITLQFISNLDEIKALIKKSLPFAILVVFMGLCNRTDAVMLERLVDDGGLQSGIYAAAYRIYYAMNTLGFLFSMLLLPMFSNLIITDKKELQQLVDLSLKGILAISIGAVSVVFVARTFIMELLYKSDASIYGTEILVLLAFTFILTCIIYILGTLLTAYARLKYLNYVFIVATIINVGINMLMIPTHGALGAAWATLVTEIIVVIAQYWICYRIVDLRLTSNTFLQITGFLILIITIGLFIDSYLTNDILIKTALMLTATIAVTLVTKMIDFKTLLSLVKSADN